MLKGLDCPNCSAKIEKEVGELEGVALSEVNLMKQTLTVSMDHNKAASMLDMVTTIVHSHEPDVEVSEQKADTSVAPDKKEKTPVYSDDKKLTIRLISGAVIYAVGMGLTLFGHVSLPVELGVLIVAYIILGWDVVWQAVKNITRGQIFDEHFLMSLSTIGAFAIGEYPEAVPMIRRVNRYKGKEKAFYICQTKNKGGDCTRHSIPEEVLKKIVLKEIQMYTALFVDYEMIMEELQQMEVSYDQVISYDTQIAKLQEEYNKCYSIKVSLADDLKSGMITKEEFDEFRESYGKKCEELDQMIEHQKKLVKQMFEGGVSAKVQLEDWKKSLEIKELDRTLLALTVDKIYIYENKQIKIRIRYQDVIEKMKVIKRFYTEHQAEYRKEVG